MALILDGKKLRDELLEKLKSELDGYSIMPKLVVILVGDNPASKLYVNNKQKTAEKLGIISEVLTYPDSVTEEELLLKINELNSDISVNAILVQLPLPKHINKYKIINAISPIKDVDGFTPENLGKLLSGEIPYVYPCTPKGIFLLLDKYGISVEGKHVVIVGRSNIVGKPLSAMMLNSNATVTICHSHTKNLKEITKTADILVSAVGRDLIKDDMVRNDAVVVDVGIFKDEFGKTRGDVDFANVSKQVEAISPVPGGVGPMTITSLMLNTVELYKFQNLKKL